MDFCARPRLVLGRIIVLLSAVAVPAVAWESVLFGPGWSAEPALSFESDKLVQDFSFAGYHRGERPLPTTVPGLQYDVTSYGADPSGTHDSTSAIQSAIDAAESAGGGVVWMPAGTFRVSPQSTASYCLRIDGSGVVLRGAGVGQTFLLNTETVMRSKHIILVTGPSSAAWASQTSPRPNLTADLTGPVTQIPVADTAGFAAGDFVILRADPGDDWALEHNEPDWVGFGAGGFGRLMYYREVLEVDAVNKTLTLDIPTRYTLKTRDNARVYRKDTLLQEIGLEDFSIGNVQHPGTTGWGTNDYSVSGTSAYDVHAHFAIRISRVKDSWVRNVNSFQAAGNTTTCHLLNNGILLSECARMTVRDCHFQRPQYGGAGGAGYMFRLQNSGDCLLQSCTAEFSRHGIVFSHMASSGNVVHDCLDKTTGKQTGSSGNENTTGKGSDHHMRFSHSNLIDVCSAQDSWYEAKYRPFGSDPKHNLTAAHTVFWNTEGQPSGRSYVVHSQQSRYGYIIGTRGAVSGVKTDGSSTGKTDPVDHVEGVGQGNSLTPFSLFREQRRRRLELPSLAAMVPQSVFFPQRQATLSPEVYFGEGTTVPLDATFVWNRVSGSGEADLKAGTGFDLDAAFTLPGTQTLQLTVSRHGSLEDDFAATGSVEVQVYPQGWAESGLGPEADAYVRLGEPDTNYDNGSLWMKQVGATSSVNREIFMRFSLAPLSGRVIEHAALVLHATEEDTQATGQTHLVTQDNWVEDAVTWNTRPSIGALLQTWPLAADYRQVIDLTSAVTTEAGGDGSLSLRHSIVSQDDNGTVFKYASRQASNASLRPQLQVRHRDATPDFPDWIEAFTGLPVVDRAAEKDPDADDLTNLEEYARRLRPDLRDTVGATLAVEPSSPGTVRLRLRDCANLPPGVYPIIEYSGSLGSTDWVALSRGEFQIAGGDLLFVLPSTHHGQPAGFYRLRLVQLP